MNDTMRIFRNYGVLAAEKRCTYTYGMAAETAVTSDKITVRIPDGWSIFENQTGEEVLESPWGWTYEPNEVLAGNVNPIFLVLDREGRKHNIRLEVVEEEAVCLGDDIAAKP